MDIEKGDMKGRIYFVLQGTHRRVKERIVAEIPLLIGDEFQALTIV